MLPFQSTAECRTALIHLFQHLEIGAQLLWVPQCLSLASGACAQYCKPTVILAMIQFKLLHALLPAQWHCYMVFMQRD